MCKDIFFNIQNFLDGIDIISLSKINKKIYIFLFELKIKTNIVFNLEIISKYVDKLTETNLSNKIISVKNKSNITNDIIHIYLSNTIDIKKISKYSQIQTLIFAQDYNIEIGNQYSFLPSDNLKEIVFGRKFNKPLGNKFTTFIPLYVEKIIFGDDFNQTLCDELSKYIPSNIKFLKFGKQFNNYIYAYLTPQNSTYPYYLFNNVRSLLPNNVETLIFGENFNQVIYHIIQLIPDTVKNLTFGTNFAQQIYEDDIYYIPSSVIELTIHSRYYLYEIPPTVKIINYINDDCEIINKIKR